MKGGGVGVRVPAPIHHAVLWLRRFARTMPGVLGAITVVSVLLCLLAGAVSANQLGEKLNRRDALLARTEPLADAAQRLYVALSAADATAAAAFVSGGIESPEVRTRYQQALADAAAALSAATAGADDEQTRRILARIAADLPAYTGLVESARTYNRQGFPVGSAYLRQASTQLMQNSLLPSAEQLSHRRFAEVQRDQRVIGEIPVAATVALLLALAACAGVSYVLLRRTNRRVNVGLVAAACATALALLWLVAATLVAANAVDSGRAGASGRFEELARMRILAQQARADETLQLITRGDITEDEQRYTAHAGELRTLLERAFPPASPARQEFARWSDGHGRQVDAYRSANYPLAVAQAIGPGQDGSASRFGKLDEALRGSITATRSELRDGVQTAGTALTLSPIGTLVLLVFAAGAIVAGIWPRLKEFL